MLRHDHHVLKTQNFPSAAFWQSCIDRWTQRYGYPPIKRIEHAALPRKSSRALGLGQRVPPSPASSPDARDLPKVIP